MGVSFDLMAPSWPIGIMNWFGVSCLSYGIVDNWQGGTVSQEKENIAWEHCEWSFLIVVLFALFERLARVCLSVWAPLARWWCRLAFGVWAPRDWISFKLNEGDPTISQHLVQKTTQNTVSIIVFFFVSLLHLTSFSMSCHVTWKPVRHNGLFIQWKQCAACCVKSWCLRLQQIQRCEHDTVFGVEAWFVSCCGAQSGAGQTFFTWTLCYWSWQSYHSAFGIIWEVCI